MLSLHKSEDASKTTLDLQNLEVLPMNLSNIVNALE